MKNRHWAWLVVSGLIAAAGCSGSVAGVAGTTGTTSSGSTSSTAGQPLTCPPPEPKNHRPAETPCAPSMPQTACTTDADCKTGTPTIAGKCVPGTGGMFCDYDACKTDADCPPAMEVCSCQDQTFGYAHKSAGSVCIAGDCHTDADCGAGLFCSPTVSPTCGSFYGVVGFYCHTCKDTCVNDSDCVSPGPGPVGYCAFDPAVGHWACGFGACAG